MFCRRCGKKLLSGARFCTHCGAKQEPIVVSTSNAEPDLEKTMGAFDANTIPPAQPQFGYGFCPDHPYNEKSK